MTNLAKRTRSRVRKLTPAERVVFIGKVKRIADDLFAKYGLLKPAPAVEKSKQG